MKKSSVSSGILNFIHSSSGFSSKKRASIFQRPYIHGKEKNHPKPYNDIAIEKANVFTSLSTMDCQGAEAERELQMLHHMLLGHDLGRVDKERVNQLYVFPQS